MQTASHMLSFYHMLSRPSKTGAFANYLGINLDGPVCLLKLAIIYRGCAHKSHHSPVQLLPPLLSWKRKTTMRREHLPSLCGSLSISAQTHASTILCLFVGVVLNPTGLRRESASRSIAPENYACTSPRCPPHRWSCELDAR